MESISSFIGSVNREVEVQLVKTCSSMGSPVLDPLSAEAPGSVAWLPEDSEGLLWQPTDKVKAKVKTNAARDFNLAFFII